MKRISLPNSGLGACIALAIAALPFGEVYGCFCTGWSSPCGEYAAADLVFVGTVIVVDPLPPDGAYARNKTVVEVERGYKNVLQGETVELHQYVGGCDPSFREGERYLFYVDRSGDDWRVHGCGRSAPVERAGDDLLYLQRLPWSQVETRISGSLRHYEDLPEDGFTFLGPLSGAKVEIEGPGVSLVLTTNQQGAYEVYGLPAGEYTITPEIPQGMKITLPHPLAPGFDISEDRRSHSVQLGEFRCSGFDFVYQSDTSLEGKVLNYEGRPVRGVCLHLLPDEGEVSRYFHIFDCSSEDGSYSLKEAPPGRYLIVTSPQDDGRPVVYFPGVMNRDEANIVEVTPGAKLEGLNLILPAEYR